MIMGGRVESSLHIDSAVGQVLDLKDHKITAIPKEVLGAFAHVTAASLVQKHLANLKRRGRNTSDFHCEK